MSDEHFLAARRRVFTARAEFDGALKAATYQLSPEHLRQEATMVATQKISGAKDAIVQSARRHPVLLGSIVVGLGILLFRRPTVAISGRLIRLAVKSVTLAAWLNERLTKWRQSHDE